LHGASPECLVMCFLETVVSHYFACIHCGISVLYNAMYQCA
jgi:hypothetical protein